MPGSKKIQSLQEEEAIEQIVETVQRAEEGAAPFTLVLGSGFSQGLVPTASEVVAESLPLWMKCLKDKTPFNPGKKIASGTRARIARNFWREFVQRNTSRELILPLNSRTGLPESYSDAYKAAFSPKYVGAMGEPAQARKFQRALIRLDKPRLNAAHFLLASLLGVQPSKSRRSNLFEASAAFCRLILTTNFDPFLQIALQAVNRLYFVTDTPELGIGDEILDDQNDALHLIYLHGTVHRRSQAATDEDIKALKEKNARILAPVLKRHGIIVLGYNGWDDAVVEALSACDRFDHRLYWCGREPDPLVPGAFGARVTDILRKPSALYVQTAGAGPFMARLCNRLVKGLPRLIDNPIAQLREMLETIDLNELKNLPTFRSNSSISAQLFPVPDSTEVFVKARAFTLKRLLEAEQHFLRKVGNRRGPGPDYSGAFIDATGESPQRQVQELLSLAEVADALGHYSEALQLTREVLQFEPLKPAELTRLWLIQGRAYFLLGKHTKAITSWSRIVDLRGAPPALVAHALKHRAAVQQHKGKPNQALADCTRLLEELPNTPAEDIAIALGIRASLWDEKGETDKALADRTRLIELPGASTEDVAAALIARGVIWSEKKETAKAIADFTRVIEERPDAPVEQMALALKNRGIVWAKEGQMEKAMVDYTRVIEHFPGARAEDMARVLRNRGALWSLKGEKEKAVADFTRLVQELPNAPIEHVAVALQNRAAIWAEKGETDKSLADATRLIELPGAPAEPVATAFALRADIWEEKGQIEHAIADYTRLIELPGATLDQKVLALNRRGSLWHQKGESKKAVEDFTRVIEEFPTASRRAQELRSAIWEQEGDSGKTVPAGTAPVEQLASLPARDPAARALIEQSILWLQQGETKKALAALAHVVDKLPNIPVENIAEALNIRAFILLRNGKAEMALTDWTRLIEELPEAPVKETVLALGNRGLLWREKGEAAKALADWTRIIEEFPGAPVVEMAVTLTNRAALWYEKGEQDKVMADLTHLIENLPNAPVRELGAALMNRGAFWYQRGQLDRSVADFTRLIEELPGAPVEQVALALNDRGAIFLQKGKLDEALADFMHLIEGLPGAPVRMVAIGLGNRGLVSYKKNDYPAFLADTEASLEKVPRLAVSLFNLGLALLACGRDAEARNAYQRAGEQFPQSIDAFGLAELHEAEGKWLGKERALPVVQLLQSLKEKYLSSEG